MTIPCLQRQRCWTLPRQGRRKLWSPGSQDVNLTILQSQFSNSPSRKSNRFLHKWRKWQGMLRVLLEILILTFVIILLSSSPSNPDSLLFSAKHWDRFHLDLDVHSYFPAYFLAHAFTLKTALGSYSYAIPNLSFGLPSFSGFYHAQLYLFNLKNLLFS